MRGGPVRPVRKRNFDSSSRASEREPVGRREMRKQLLVVLLPLLVLIAAGETRSTENGATGRTTLQRVDVMRGTDGISVEMIGHGQMTPKVSLLESPARVLVTLSNTVATTSQNHVSVGRDGVKGVRIGMDGQTPPTTSVVIDLLSSCKYEVVPGSDGKVVVKLHPDAAATPAPKAVATPEAAKAPASMHRTAAQAPVTEQKPDASAKNDF